MGSKSPGHTGFKVTVLWFLYWCIVWYSASVPLQVLSSQGEQHHGIRTETSSAETSISR